MTRGALLTEALAALARGWALTPLAGKKPIFDAWQERPMPTPAQVRQWVEWGHNLGLRTGGVSGVLVIDHDPRHDDGAPLPVLPATPTVNTGGGGTHRYYRCPADPPPNSAGRIHPALDVKSIGGQVVFAGSIHPDTKCPYAWAPGLDPDSVPMADVPADLLAHMHAAREESARVTLPASLTDDGRTRRARAYLAKVPGGVSGEHGSRPCFRAACILVHGFGLTEDEAFTLLVNEYSPRCTPPWNEKELRHKVEDAARQPGARSFVLEASRGAPAWATSALSVPSPARIVLPRRVSRAMVGLLQTGRHTKYTQPDGTLDISRAVFGVAISMLRAGMSRSDAASAIAASALRAALRARGADGMFWLARTVERAEIALARDGVRSA